MMYAVLDIGSNTVRMLVGKCDAGRLHPVIRERQITRLAGESTVETGLSARAIHRTLAALACFSIKLQQLNIPCLRAVATAAVRDAVNQNDFIDQVRQQTGLDVEVIDGDEEARLTAAGVLSVVTPVPENALIFDIGGGSTELILVSNGRITAQKSYSVGVVRLCEGYKDKIERRQAIDAALTDFGAMTRQNNLTAGSFTVIGTAGTMTTLAAVDMGMTSYDAEKINNHQLSVQWLQELYQRMESMTISEREQVPGMEQGRADLILPGLQLAVAIAEAHGVADLKVSDAGLLEGVLLAACHD
ncbi:MAG: Ppx/GppA phosphatase family protein [Pelovirga sp.]